MSESIVCFEYPNCDRRHAGGAGGVPVHPPTGSRISGDEPLIRDEVTAEPVARPAATGPVPVSDFHRAEDAEQRGEGICRTCLAPIWNEGGTIDHKRRDKGWSDRVERGGDSLVCFRAVEYRHVPLAGREACIYDRAFARGQASHG